MLTRSPSPALAVVMVIGVAALPLDVDSLLFGSWVLF
jgi:hypothetical protein